MTGRSRAGAGLALLAWAAWWLPACALGVAAPRTASAATPTPAARPAPAHPAAAPAAGPRRVTILVLDMSGSMRDNDPDNVRCAAARTFIGLSRPDEMVGLIGFTDQPDAWSAAPVWTTSAGQQQLEAQVSCTPGGNTPTLSALRQAWQMLADVPGQGTRSVVLLTDGVPTPGTDAQIGTIETDVVRMFRERSWRIDTVALGAGEEGTDIQFAFLQRIAHDTNGQFTDGSLGRPATAFNLLPAFIQVLREEEAGRRSTGPSVESQSSGPLSFTVAPSATRLDVVVVCTAPCARVRLRTPAGAEVGGQQPVSAAPQAPPYGAVFSLEGQLPWQRSASWTVTVEGGGAVRVESLVDVPLDIDLRAQAPPHPLGQPITVSASVIEKDGTPYPAGRLILNGSVQHGPDGPAVPGGAFSLGRGADGRYRGALTIPAAEGPGSYDVTVTAFTDVPVATRSAVVDVGAFPRPVLAAAATATRWPVLGGVYSLPPLNGLGDVALQGPPSPTVSLTGSLIGLDGRPYTKPSILSADVTRPDGRVTATATTHPAGPGRFRLSFPAPTAGDYLVTLRTGGPESFGQTLPATTRIRVAVEDPTLAGAARALLVTMALAALLAAVLLAVRFCLLQPPYGALLPVEGTRRQRMARGRNPFAALWCRSRWWRRDGLEFRFCGDGIDVRRRPGRRTAWRRENGGELPASFERVHRLRLGDRVYAIDARREPRATPARLLVAVARALGIQGPGERRRRPRQ